MPFCLDYSRIYKNMLGPMCKATWRLVMAMAQRLEVYCGGDRVKTRDSVKGSKNMKK